VLPDGYRQTTAAFEPVALGGSRARRHDFGIRRDPTWKAPAYLTIADLDSLPGRSPAERVSPPHEFERTNATGQRRGR
jgi:hypothetical protein